MNPDGKPPRKSGPLRVPLTQPRKASSRESWFRVLTLVAILASLVIAFWSLFWVWFPLQQQAQTLGARADRISDEVDQLESKWSRPKVAKLEADYETIRSNLFTNEDSFNAWLEQLKAQASPLHLGVRVVSGKPASLAADTSSLAVIPASVSLEITPLPGGKESPYQRLLRLTQRLQRTDRRAVLTEMTVTGGASSVRKAVLVFRLWAAQQHIP